MFTHFWLFKGVREAALVSAPHPSGQLWVLHVSTQRHHAGAVANVDRRPIAGGQQQVDVVSSRLSSHQVLGAAHHLQRSVKVAQGRDTRGGVSVRVGLMLFTLCGQSLDSLPAVR